MRLWLTLASISVLGCKEAELYCRMYSERLKVGPTRSNHVFRISSQERQTIGDITIIVSTFDFLLAS